MKHSKAAFAAIFISLIVCCTYAQQKRVGTFNRRAVALAYYRSPQWAQVLSQKRAELKAAQQADDPKKVDELNKWFGESQELAHQQVFGSEPVDNILFAMKPAIQEICKAQNLAGVVPSPAPGSTQSVDVTEALLDWLQADEKTRDLIRQMPQK